MPTLRDVQKRIRSVKSTRRITSAMEKLAAAMMRRAQQRVEQAKPYAAKLDEMLSHLAAAATEEIVHPFFEERPVKRRTAVLISSDKGLCGSFNANVIRKANEWLGRQAEDSAETELVLLGKKVNDYYKRRPHPIVRYEGDWKGRLDYDRARDVVAMLTERFVTGQTDEIVLIYTRFLSMAKYRVADDRYLPVPRPQLADEDEHQQSDYIFEPDAERIYAALMPSYATTKLVTAMVESFAAEHGSRMVAMNNATKNAGEMIDRLTLDYNKARQAQITTELLEVVSGAEALKG
jgi:F-type H+-transporting ATPase subunit gamma